MCASRVLGMEVFPRIKITANLSSRSQHFLATLPGQYELVEFIVVKDCYSHRFASWLDLRGLFASFRFVFCSGFCNLGTAQRIYLGWISG